MSCLRLVLVANYKKQLIGCETKMSIAGLGKKIICNNKRYILGAILAALLLWVAALKLFKSNEIKDIDSPIPQVFATRAQASDEMVFVRASGVTKASRKINLLSETAGQIYQLHNRKGTILNTHDPIVTIHLDDRNQQLKEAQASHALAKEKVEIAKKLTEGNFRSEISLKTARVEYESAAVRLARIEKDIANTRITAPYKGVLGDVFLEEGSVVAPGTPVASLLEMDPLLVQVYVSEKNHGRFKVGSSSTLTFANGITTKGVIKFISSIADAKTHMFLVEVAASNVDFNIPEGVTAQVDIPTESAKVHKILPSVLSLDANGDMTVKVVDESNRVQAYVVKLIQSVGSIIWVTGLPEESIIINYGGPFVNVGDEVRWQPTAKLKGPRDD